MAIETCKKCKRELGQAMLVRCRENDCPSKPKSTQEQVKIAGPLAVVATLASLGLITYYFTHQPEDSAPAGAKPVVVRGNESSTIASRDTTSGDNSGGIMSWFSGRSAEPPAPVAVDENKIDSRAASRVTTFSCTGSLSASKEAVCSNWGLAIMDYNLSVLMQTAMSRGTSADEIRAQQQSWQRELDRLGGDVDKVRAHYQARIEKLSKQI
jgi:hypothetical protein